MRLGCRGALVRTGKFRESDLQAGTPDVVLESVTAVNAGGQKKSGVQVKGVIGEHIRFELLLPDEWNGRFVMGGGGGFVSPVLNVTPTNPSSPARHT